MLSQSLLNLVKLIANQFGLDHTLVAAIIMVESGGSPCAINYEPKWQYHWNVAHFAKQLGENEEMEYRGQMMSWGVMQVMGTVAREYNFRGWFPELCTLSVGIEYGCKHLDMLFKRYKGKKSVFLDAIAAYNRGSVKKTKNGEYVNQEYVDKVMEAYKQLVRSELVN